MANQSQPNAGEQSAADDEALAEAINAVGAQDTSAVDTAAELAAANDRLLRLHAEMQNLRNRTSREIADERKYAALPVLRDLLPVQAGEVENLLEGFRLVRQQLVTTLANHGAEAINALGQLFDPNFHQAILHQPSNEPANTVTMVTQEGYKLHDRVVRPAQVIVSSGPAPK
jgi:molecular chaperone GrpE